MLTIGTGIAYEAHGEGVWNIEYSLVPVTEAGEMMRFPGSRIETSGSPSSELLDSNPGVDLAD